MRARQHATLVARIPGSVIALPFREGDAVSAGAVVARTEDHALRAALAAAGAERDATEADRARAATLLLHVVDASNARRAEQIAQVDSVLEEIGAVQLPQLLIYNKIDRLEIAPRIDRDAEGRAQAVWICAQRAEGLDLLLSAVAERLARFARRARLPRATSRNPRESAGEEAERAAGRSLPTVVVPPGVDVARFRPVDAAERAQGHAGGESPPVD